jgi:hypothetical protein
MVFAFSARSSQPLFSLSVFAYLSYYQPFSFKKYATPSIAISGLKPCAIHIFILILPAD